jgi:prepilin-type N-terminal cleavage/methylation domain-containing protein
MTRRREAGFTLVELIVAVALLGLLAATMGGLIFQIIQTTETGYEESVTNYELQNVGYWFHRDVQDTTAVTTGASLVLTQADNSTRTYLVSGTDLLRQSDGPTLTLSQNVSSANFSRSGQVVSMTVVIAPSGRQAISRETTLSATMRPSP